MIRTKLGWWLRCLADRIDYPHAPRVLSYSFTFERGEGIKFRDDSKGCPLGIIHYDQYDRAWNEADKK